MITYYNEYLKTLLSLGLIYFVIFMISKKQRNEVQCVCDYEERYMTVHALEFLSIFEDQFSFYYNYVAESVISCIWPNVSREKQDISN